MSRPNLVLLMNPVSKVRTYCECLVVGGTLPAVTARLLCSQRRLSLPMGYKLEVVFHKPDGYILLLLIATSVRHFYGP